MRENNFIIKSVRKASSFNRYSVRLKIDATLHDDLEYFLTHHQKSISDLVDKLLRNDFESIRYTDPSYPA